jgi:predicted alpha/beta hydrolase family esterase
MTDTRVLILPGYGGSGPQHWQSLWQAEQPAAFSRVEQRDWQQPLCAEWCAVLEQAVAAAGEDTVLVAHSLACLQVAHWAARSGLRIGGALLVAVPDPAGAEFPAAAQGFAPVPMRTLAFPSIVVASTDDPYGGLRYANVCATAWGSQLISLGAAGHINAASGLGDWKPGRDLLRQLIA